jgi:hypothetical protein
MLECPVTVTVSGITVMVRRTGEVQREKVYGEGMQR